MLNLIATLKQENKQFIAQYERLYSQPVEKVWEAITNNEKLKLWMAHLEIVDYREGGKILFHYNDGSEAFEEMEITNFKEGSVIEFEWGEDHVRFRSISNEGWITINYEGIH